MIEITRLVLPDKGANESQRAYDRRVKDGRWCSEAASEAARKNFEMERAAPNAKGHDAIDSDGEKYEHKMLTKNAYFRRSAYTGASRMCYPTAVSESCEVGFLISCTSDVKRPFSVKISRATVFEWLANGYIDPVTGKLNRNDFFNLIRPYDESGLVPPSGYTLEKTERDAAKRRDPKNMRTRLKRSFSSWECHHEQEKIRVVADIEKLEASCLV